MIKNRISKNFAKLKSWSDKHQIEAFRLYDRDIPEYPFIVDIYKNYLVIYDKSDAIKDQNKNHFPLLMTALLEIFPETPESQIIFKKRLRQEGLNQYEKIDNSEKSFTVRESQGLFKVNLWDYLDTGLFLDHRPLRQWVFKEASQKKMLNLFCYTGAISVFGALGGAQVTSVDMSQTYLNWAQENFILNNISLTNHRFIQKNALEYLESIQGQEKFDLIVLDPPTFSNSKRMESAFEVEKDQDFLVEHCMKLLNPDGKLYFSNNKRKFKLSDAIKTRFKVKDATEKSIPIDFHDKKIHNCFEIKN